MALEGQGREQKSLRLVHGDSQDWSQLAKHCVAFANALGGVILIGIEDGCDQPPEGQKIPDGLLDKIRRRVSEITVGLSLTAEVITAKNEAKYISLEIPRSNGLASTTRGECFVRIGDTSRPLKGDEIQRISDERSNVPWERKTNLQIDRSSADSEKVNALVEMLRGSELVKPLVKIKTVDELLDHYRLAEGNFLTNLGLLCVGSSSDRGKLGTAPIIQVIKFDEFEQKINKFCWDDHTLSPIELIPAIWEEVPDFSEYYEVPKKITRQQIPAFEEVVVRELLANAFVHRPYSQKGDILIEIHPKFLRITNPGQLPPGVTPENALHKSVRRNDDFARLFHDLNLIEREGSGLDRIYEILLSKGRAVPEIIEDADSVTVVIHRQILKPEVIDMMALVNSRFKFTLRERIALGFLGQNNGLSTHDLCHKLALKSVNDLQPWLRGISKSGLVRKVGNTRATKYFVDWERIKILNSGSPQAAPEKIEAHRLAELIVTDVEKHPYSPIREIHSRLGENIPRNRIKRGLSGLIKSGKLVSEGVKRGVRYRVP